MEITIDGNTEEVEFLDDVGDGVTEGGPLFLIGHEFGWTHLVRADNSEVAEDTWLDVQETVKEDDLYKAYGYRTQQEFEDRPEDDEGQLADGYLIQPNARGTGVVFVTEYHRVRKVGLINLKLAYDD